MVNQRNGNNIPSARVLASVAAAKKELETAGAWNETTKEPGINATQSNLTPKQSAVLDAYIEARKENRCLFSELTESEKSEVRFLIGERF